jgi:hypothetical protein
MTREKPEIRVNRTTEGDLKMTLIGLEGIFIALNWIQLGCIDGDVEGEQKTARGGLILAGKMLIEEISERVGMNLLPGATTL